MRREEQEEKRAGGICWRPREPWSGGAGRSLRAELGSPRSQQGGAYLQVPVYNVFLVTIVHSRNDLGGRGKVGYLWLPKPSASLSGL